MAITSTKEYPISAPTLLESIRGRWKLTILWYLSQGPFGFRELKSSIGHISPSVLSAQLKQLHADGLILKKVFKYREPGVLYLLTSLGKAVAPIFKTIDTVSRSHSNDE